MASSNHSTFHFNPAATHFPEALGPGVSFPLARNTDLQREDTVSLDPKYTDSCRIGLVKAEWMIDVEGANSKQKRVSLLTITLQGGYDYICIAHPFQSFNTF